MHGSLEYALTWKRQAMPSGPPICRLRASARRTSGKGFGGWHTPTAVDAKGRTYTYDGHDKTKPRLSNEGLIKGYPTPRADKAGWPTPMERDWRSGKVSDEVRDRNSRPLNEQVELAKGWPTPDAGAFAVGADLDNHMKRVKKLKEKKYNGNGAGLPLGIVSQMAQKGWGTPRSVEAGHSTGNPDRATDRKARLEDQVLGTITSGSPASTAPTGALNPAFTRWLMGFPPAWDGCAPTATRSRRSSQPSL